MSPGAEFDHNLMLLTQTSQTDYEQLWRLDVLGLKDTSENDQGDVYTEFKEQLKRDERGWYESGLPWKANHPPLPNNEKGSLRRLDSLVRKLERTDKYEAYDQILRSQLNEGIIEPAPKIPQGKEFYLPHKCVERANAESTKLRVVYDASARAQSNSPSLNDCLNTGPPLQNKLWSVLVRQRSYPVSVCGDIEKAFLQVCVKICERDELIQIYRFTRALFGLTCSPFLLGGVIDQHLELWQKREPEIVAELRKNLYVDDLLSGGTTVAEAQEKKRKMTDVLSDATFKLPKWNASEKELEGDGDVVGDEKAESQTFAKQQLNVKSGDSKLLGLAWDKISDTLTVTFPQESLSTTKRGILSKLARIYDPLGLVSPITVAGKMIYREVCDAKWSWDTQIEGKMADRWKVWEGSLPSGETVQRSLFQYHEKATTISLHAFGDASYKGVCAAVYAVVEQPSGTTQTLVAAKARLAKQGLTIPRLELIGAHMAANLITNVHEALENDLVIPLHCWLDSTVVLYWLQGNGTFKQFVANRVNKINGHKDIEWHYVPTKDNPADLGSRGTKQLSELWRNGPEWLSSQENWPASPVIKSTIESQAEEKMEREIVACTVQPEEKKDLFDVLIEVHITNVWRVLRVCAWVQRFISNLKLTKVSRNLGPLTTKELEEQQEWWIKRVQQNPGNVDSFQTDRVRLNLQENEQGILECRGRIVGQYPIYLPDGAPFTHALVHEAHLHMLHGGVVLTMARVRETFWVPRLRKLVKEVRKRCWGCKRFQVSAYAAPPPGQLPVSRTRGERPYEVVGFDFAGPIKFIIKGKTEGKSYLCLFACSLTRGVYLELLHTLEMEEFLSCLKKFVARRGRPRLIYSDNGSTFKGAASWMKKVMNDEKLHDYLAKNKIEWKFNLSRAPWWGGQFERLVGIFKGAFYKAIGNGMLSFSELAEIVTDVEVAINNRPLDYVEEDVQLPLLTPNSLLFLQPNYLPELESHHLEEPNLRRRGRHLSRVKDAMWARWSKEYIKSLRERHRLQGVRGVRAPAVDEIVIIKSEEKNRNRWKLGKVVELIRGRDGVVRRSEGPNGKGSTGKNTAAFVSTGAEVRSVGEEKFEC